MCSAHNFRKSKYKKRSMFSSELLEDVVDDVDIFSKTDMTLF